MTPLLKQILIENPEVHASHLITASGIGQYYTDDQQSKDRSYHLPPTSEFDLRDGEPMTVFTKSGDTSPGVRWTNIYKDDVIDGFMLTASASIYDNKGVFHGIIGIDVPLQSVIGDILQPGDSGLDDDKILFSFLLDRNSEVIAVPGPYYSFLGLTVDSSKLINSSNRLDVALADSSKEDVRELAHALEGKNTSFTKIYHEGKSHLVVTHRMTKLGWILGVVVQEDNLLLAVQESRIALIDTIRSIKLKGIVSSLLTMCIAIVALFFAVRYLVLPLRALIDSTERIAGGDLSTRCQVTTTDEVGSLTVSFNAMVAQLQVARNQQKTHSELLESVVESRNTELIQKKNEVQITIDLLEKEIERRQIISKALKNSQHQYFATLDASMAGVFIIDSGIFTYVNSSFAEMMQYSRDELIGLSPLDSIIDDDKPLVEENSRRRLAGETTPPYTVKWIRKDGSSFLGEVWAMVNSWQKRPIMVVTLTDVTNIKENEARLKLQDRQLQKSLDEKEVLLREIYHRTKNNMLVIISLLDLQSQDVEDDAVRKIFLETESRIRAMALVHEKLYQSKDLSRIDLGEYLYDVVNSLLKSMVVDGRIKLLVSDFDPVSITIDYAVPLGLIVNEIVTNAIKHGYPGNRFGTIYLNLGTNRAGEIVLVVGDDGVGLPEGIDLEQTTTFGMHVIIYSLVRLQLGGTVYVDGENGTSYRISFSEPKNIRRI